ncbi:MAG TPA: hypothetical protein VFG20_04100 [Planctomycetaceae bacterium]|nr:hypothetical protein [Planctomycetaceae bacterium]
MLKIARSVCSPSAVIVSGMLVCSFSLYVVSEYRATVTQSPHALSPVASLCEHCRSTNAVEKDVTLWRCFHCQKCNIGVISPRLLQ